MAKPVTSGIWKLTCLGQFSKTVQESTWATLRAFLASLGAMAITYLFRLQQRRQRVTWSRISGEFLASSLYMAFSLNAHLCGPVLEDGAGVHVGHAESVLGLSGSHGQHPAQPRAASVPAAMWGVILLVTTGRTNTRLLTRLHQGCSHRAESHASMMY